MCGIVGFINKDIKDKKEIIKKMADKMNHRGPDGEGYFISDNIALAHKRLSIIDLSESGTQPIYNEDKSLVIIFNGEIYNYKELKSELKNYGHTFTTDTDTEVIIHGYELWGKDVVNHLRGMFAFAIWDTKKEELFLARDHFGIKPLYYGKFNESFIFASEIKAFLPFPDFKKEVNEKLINSYLCFNSSVCEETLFKGVYRLNPGHTLTYKNGEIIISRYFHLEFDEKETEMENIVKDIQEAMKDSVSHHLISDTTVGSFLSSGIDSSYLVCLSKVENTYTVGYEDERYDEIRKAKDLTDKLGIKNTGALIDKNIYLKEFPKIIYHMDEPLADPAGIAVYFASLAASKDLKVVMSGEGADELFAGYLTNKDEIDHLWYLSIPKFIKRLAAIIASPLKDVKGFNYIYRIGTPLEKHSIGLARVFRDKEAINILKMKNQVKTLDIVKPYYEEYKNCSNLIKRQVMDFYFWLVPDFLHAVDRTAMMCSLEARTPFLDKEVYEVARHLPFYAKLNNETTKVALRRAAQDYIPNESFKRRKLGFPVPLREWIKEDDLYNEIKTKFTSSSANKFFNTKKILKLLETHKSGKRDCYKKVWTIYTFLVWYDIYFSKEEVNL